MCMLSTFDLQADSKLDRCADISQPATSQSPLYACCVKLRCCLTSSSVVPVGAKRDCCAGPPGQLRLVSIVCPQEAVLPAGLLIKVTVMAGMINRT